jgi:hypothetical protein
MRDDVDAVTSMSANVPSSSFAHQIPMSADESSGSVTDAMTRRTADATASPSVVRGSARYAAARGTATNGSAGIRNRGPGLNPPNGRK